MEDWLRLIDAETEAELMDIQQTTKIPEVKETIVRLRRLSANERIRQEAYYREKRLHDEASALGHARREGIAEGRAEGRVEGIAEGRAEGRAEVRRELIDRLRAGGMSESQIRALLGEE